MNSGSEIVNQPVNYLLKYHLEYSQIKNLTDDAGQTAFLIIIGKVSKSLGISNVPDEADRKGILKFLFRNFSDVTTGEFAYAFELYALGKLNVDKSKHHFHTFNFEFIAAVLYAYKNYAKPSLAQHAKSQEQQQLPPHQVSWLEFAEGNHKSVLAFISEHNSISVNGVLIPTDWESCFDYLESIGEIKMSTEEKLEFKIEHKMELLEEAQKVRGTIMAYSYQQLVDQANNEKYLSWSCRRQCAINYYKTLLKKK